MSAYRKDFDGWNEWKKKINQNTQGMYFVQQEVWWCAIGINIGYEQDGVGDLAKRPVLIVRKLSTQTCIIVPLTTSMKQHPLRLYVGVIHGKKSYAILSQLRVIDVKRLIEKMAIIDINTFNKIRNAAKDML